MLHAVRMEEATLAQVRYALATMLDPRSPPGTAKESSDWLQEFRYRRSKKDAHFVMIMPRVAIYLVFVMKSETTMTSQLRESIHLSYNWGISQCPGTTTNAGLVGRSGRRPRCLVPGLL